MLNILRYIFYFILQLVLKILLFLEKYFKLVVTRMLTISYNGSKIKSKYSIRRHNYEKRGKKKISEAYYFFAEKIIILPNPVVRRG